MHRGGLLTLFLSWQNSIWLESQDKRDQIYFIFTSRGLANISSINSSRSETNPENKSTLITEEASSCLSKQLNKTENCISPDDETKVTNDRELNTELWSCVNQEVGLGSHSLSHSSPVPNKPYGFCGRKHHKRKKKELNSAESHWGGFTNRRTENRNKRERGPQFKQLG